MPKVEIINTGSINTGIGAGINFAKEKESSNTSIIQPMDDNGLSEKLASSKITDDDIKNLAATNSSSILDSTYHSNGLYKRYEIDLFKNRYRFGILNPYESLSSAREYLFFTKPDLNIYPRDDRNGVPRKTMADYLRTQSYWRELEDKYPEVLESLQCSRGNKKDPFNHLLENMVESNLDIPGLDSEMIETSNNMYGVGYTYHGSSESSDDNFDFSLEFKDTKYLPVYHFFKAYEEYQSIKHHGLVKPYDKYITEKVLYDQYSIYKFLVDEDGETIIYYAKLYGVKSKSLPRDAFANTVFDNGISYSINFNAAFFRDMQPYILEEFNNITKSFYDSLDYQIDIYNHTLDQVDNRAARCAHIVKEPSNVAPTKYVYKLKWRGDAIS